MKTRNALILVGSAKGEMRSTSDALGSYLGEQLTAQGINVTQQYVHRALRTPQRRQALLTASDQADWLILTFPLYVDSLPYLLTQALEVIAAQRDMQATPRPGHVVAIANCGFPEAQHNETALAICRLFAEQAHFQWAGGLALGQGGAIGGLPLTTRGGMTRNVIKALDLTATALAQGQTVPTAAVELMAKPLMPARIYTLMGNLGWFWEARRQGVIRHLNARPFA